MAGEFELIILSLFPLMLGIIIARMFIDVYGRADLLNKLAKKNMGVAEMFYGDRKIKTYLINLNEPTFQVGTGKLYEIILDKSYRRGNVSVLQYSAEDAIPKTPLEITGLKPLESPAILQSQKRNIFSLMVAQIMNDESKTIKLCLVAAAIAALIGLVNVALSMGAGSSAQTCVDVINAVNQSLYYR